MICRRLKIQCGDDRPCKNCMKRKLECGASIFHYHDAKTKTGGKVQNPPDTDSEELSSAPSYVPSTELPDLYDQGETQENNNAYYFPGLEAGMVMNIDQINSLLHAMGFPSASTSMIEGESSSSPMFYPQPDSAELDPNYMHTDQVTTGWLHSGGIDAVVAADIATEDANDGPIQVDATARVGQTLDLSACQPEQCKKNRIQI